MNRPTTAAPAADPKQPPAAAAAQPPAAPQATKAPGQVPPPQAPTMQPPPHGQQKPPQKGKAPVMYRYGMPVLHSGELLSILFTQRGLGSRIKVMIGRETVGAWRGLGG